MKTKHSSFKGNIYGMILWKLGLLTIIYSLSRLFFILFNLSHFPELGFGEALYLMFVGMRFDITTITILSLPFIFWNTLPLPYRYSRGWKFISNLLFFPVNILAYTGNFTDIVYYRFILKRTTADIFHFIKQEGDSFWSLLPQFIQDFWVFTLLWLFITIFFIWGCTRLKLKKPNKNERVWVYGLKHLIPSVIITALVIIAGRGGTQLKPISNITAGQYTQPSYTPIALNTPFSILKTVDQKGITDPQYYSEAFCLEHFNPKIQFKDSTAFQKKNVVIIILESFSAEHSAYFNQSIPGYLGFTPYLDSIARISLSYKGWANGKRSIEGIPAILSSIPSWMPKDYASSIYGNNQINSLANMLATEGYQTAFFHGGNNGTMSFDAFAQLAGFQEYFGRNEYNNDQDYDGKWGIFDEPFFQYFAKSLSQFQQPFLASIFSLSSHHPYTIPEQHIGKFRKGKLKIQESVMYADYALYQFFETAKKQDWYKNTLFVITADHTSEADIPFYRTSVGQYSIPIIFFDPKKEITADSHITVQQIDIMPTIMNDLHYPKDFFSFGRSIFDSTATHYAMQFTNNNYQLIQGDYALQFDGKSSRSLYNFETDSLLTKNLVGQENAQEIQMETLSKVLIQEYNTALIGNSLTIKAEQINQNHEGAK